MSLYGDLEGLNGADGELDVLAPEALSAALTVQVGFLAIRGSCATSSVIGLSPTPTAAGLRIESTSAIDVTLTDLTFTSSVATSAWALDIDAPSVRLRIRRVRIFSAGSGIRVRGEEVDLRIEELVMTCAGDGLEIKSGGGEACSRLSSSFIAAARPMVISGSGLVVRDSKFDVLSLTPGPAVQANWLARARFERCSFGGAAESGVLLRSAEGPAEDVQITRSRGEASCATFCRVDSGAEFAPMHGLWLDGCDHYGMAEGATLLDVSGSPPFPGSAYVRAPFVPHPTTAIAPLVAGLEVLSATAARVSGQGSDPLRAGGNRLRDTAFQGGGWSLTADGGTAAPLPNAVDPFFGSVDVLSLQTFGTLVVQQLVTAPRDGLFWLSDGPEYFTFSIYARRVDAGVGGVHPPLSLTTWIIGESGRVLGGGRGAVFAVGDVWHRFTTHAVLNPGDQSLLIVMEFKGTSGSPASAWLYAPQFEPGFGATAFQPVGPVGRAPRQLQAKAVGLATFGYATGQTPSEVAQGMEPGDRLYQIRPSYDTSDREGWVAGASGKLLRFDRLGAKFEEAGCLSQYAVYQPGRLEPVRLDTARRLLQLPAAFYESLEAHYGPKMKTPFGPDPAPDRHLVVIDEVRRLAEARDRGLVLPRTTGPGRPP